MFIYSSITMRDLIRNYKMILAGKNRDSESDSEYQPFSSSCTSASSFGTFGDPYEPGTSSADTEEEQSHENDSSATKNHQPLLKKHFERQFIFPPSFEPPELDVYTNHENVYDQHRHYAKISGLLSDDSNSVHIQNKNFLQDYSDSDSYGPFPDYREEEKPTHNSLISIFAVWNTTMGSSLLAMSWGLEKSGLFPGIAINIAIAGICLYSAYLLLDVNERHGMPGQAIEVCDLCKMLIGKWAEILAKVFSVVVLLGSNIVYWILMSNFLYNSVYFLYGIILSHGSDPEPNMAVICPKEFILSDNTTDSIFVSNPPSMFEKVWDLYSTVPIFLAILMFPILNFKSATFFTKFNSLGTISVAYLLLFVAIKSGMWGVNMPNWTSQIYIKPTVGALSGMLSLSYFIHNIIISIMRNNRHQEHNGRDLSIAFGLITFTYLFIGVVFYICFPLAKSCIEDNILNNFSKHDVMTLIARILLMFQLFTVFPLIAFMLRNDILTNINIVFKNYRFGDFTYGRVIFLNTIVLFICIMFACFLPRIGTLIRYTGAMSGMVYIFMLPSLLKIASLKKERNLTLPKVVLYVALIVVGFVNLTSQFFITDK